MLQDQQFNFASQVQFTREHVSSAQVSGDNFFLAIGSYQYLKIFYHKSKKLIKNINQEWDVRIIKFSNDSKIIFCGNSSGRLNVYDIRENFQQIYQLRMPYGIRDLIIIDEGMILTCSQKSLQITNIKHKQQLLKIQYANKSIEAIEFDQSRDWIIYVKGSKETSRSIYFVDRQNGKFLFKQKTSHSSLIKKIQLFSNGYYLLSFCQLLLELWQIDYQNLSLIKVNQFKQHLNLTSILNNYGLVQIHGREFVYMIDHNFIVILIKQKIEELEIDEDIEEYPIYIQTRQLNSLKYIIFPVYIRCMGQLNEKLVVLKKR